MKTNKALLILVMAMLAAGAIAAGPVQNRGRAGGTPPTVAPLTRGEEDTILRMREEEKLARDVYLTLAELWDCPVFSNIAASEQRHMEAVGLLVTRYGLTDPVVDDAVGAFTAPEFTGLYDTFIATGAGSLLEALTVGVQIEELDIADLEQAIEETEKGDIEWVYTNLLRASKNHLRAFNRNIAADGTPCTFEPGTRQAGAGAGQANGLARQGRGKGSGRGDRQQKRDGSGSCDRQRARDGSCAAEPVK